MYNSWTNVLNVALYALNSLQYLCCIILKTKKMEAKEPTTFNNLPERMDCLISEVFELKRILIQRIEKPEEIPKYLNTEKALVYLKKIGFPMSKSRLYKLTANRKIPFHKSGNTLLFSMEEISQWCEDDIHAKNNKNISNQFIIKTAQKKSHKTI